MAWHGMVWQFVGAVIDSFNEAMHEHGGNGAAELFMTKTQREWVETQVGTSQ